MMEMNFGFIVTANCTSQENNNPDGTPVKKEIPINFDIDTAIKVLFRYQDNSFEINEGIKITFFTNPAVMVLSVKDDDVYIITNHEQFLRDVRMGYEYLTALNKFATILEFDFQAGIDLQK